MGEFPDGTSEEALAYFTRKFTELEGQVSLLEQRARGGAPAADVASAVRRLTSSVDEANAVGDLAALRDRLGTLSGAVGELTEKQSAEAAEAVAHAVAEREAIVVEAERLATLDPAKIQWKQVSTQLDALFQSWQKHQQSGPRSSGGGGGGPSGP